MKHLHRSKPHQRRPEFKLTVGEGEIEFRDKTQKSWPQATEDVYVLTYATLLGQDIHKTERVECSSYEAAWEEARQLGVTLMDWPLWLRPVKTFKHSTKRGVVDLPLGMNPVDLNPNRFKRSLHTTARSVSVKRRSR